MIKTYKKILLVVLLVAVLFILIVFLNNQSNNQMSTSNPSSTSTAINLSPPTEEDKKRAEDNKKNIEIRDELVESQKTQSSGTIKPVTPIISYAGQYGQYVEVGGFVGNLYEDEGICTAQFSKEGVSPFVETVQAIKSANSVDCPVMKAPVNKFQPKGSWNVVVLYNSSSASGTSTTKTVEVK